MKSFVTSHDGKKRICISKITCFIILFFGASLVHAAQLGNIVNITENENVYEISTSDGAKTRVQFYEPDIFRIWVGPNGYYSDPAGSEETPLVVYNEDPIPVVQRDEGSYYSLTSDSCVLRIYKQPCTFALYKLDNSTLVFEESKSITYSNSSYQSIDRQTDEHFYGCGMQNGHFSHRDQTISIASVADWEEDGAPNAVPFYMTLNGYGVFRNTYSRGTYTFKSPVTASHNENRFDGYFFYGDLKNILDGYTLITGRPFMTPHWGLEFGDADRYTQGSYECVSYADKYIDNDMPVGWFLPNDGYGMDFSRVPEVQDELEKRNIFTGMWTDKGLDFATYIGTHGIRLFKLDIAWVGVGYKFSLNACRTVYEAIENNSDARGILWVTLGWAGSHRYSIMWTGDNTGSMDWLRWHIPTASGSGLSAQNGGTGDVEGIFGGDRNTYVRDLQWKCFTSYMMIIDNWANHEKKPFSYGGIYTDHNRKALKLKSRLMPYLYKYSYDCHMTGVPVQRAMVLEFPEDENTWEESGYNALTKYQFMSGEWFLVAPVYKNTNTWDFYLPDGQWTDFESGEVYEGGQKVFGYDVSNYKLPVLVKEGAIIPMYPETFYENRKQQRPKDPLQVDIYPHSSKVTEFELFEDDGLTYKFRDKKYNKTLFTCDAVSRSDALMISVDGGFEGNGYDGMLQKRNYIFTIHKDVSPEKIAIQLDGASVEELTKVADTTALASVENGWCYAEHKNGIVYVKVSDQSWNSKFKILVDKEITSISQKKNSLKQIQSLTAIAKNRSVVVEYLSDCNNKISQLSLFTVNGKLITQKEILVKEGKQRVVLTNSKNQNIQLPVGVYILRIKLDGVMRIKTLTISN